MHSYVRVTRRIANCHETQVMQRFGDRITLEETGATPEEIRSQTMAPQHFGAAECTLHWNNKTCAVPLAQIHGRDGNYLRQLFRVQFNIDPSVVITADTLLLCSEIDVGSMKIVPALPSAFRIDALWHIVWNRGSCITSLSPPGRRMPLLVLLAM
eukprot:TRINITY_DN15938_c0_g1_i1.p2 TRINITY_DN15938_c0_g1~~TRINITY_DN15938_c0_g1_i1.p2  ORF type:complete len:155 (-),score=13.78 TRINITY_DN15938_c0_g1_i1:75-539(-)